MKQKTITELTPQELAVRREEWRTRSQKYRDSERETRLLKKDMTVQEYWDYFSTTSASHELKVFAKDFRKQVLQELGRDKCHEIDECLDFVATALHGFKRKIFRKVTLESGSKQEMVGDLFADVIGRHVIADTHKYDLERSPTFSTAYRQLLTLLDRRYGKNLESHDDLERANAIAVRDELNSEAGSPTRAEVEE